MHVEGHGFYTRIYIDIYILKFVIAIKLVKREFQRFIETGVVDNKYAIDVNAVVIRDKFIIIKNIAVLLLEIVFFIMK
jgi:hypothetical protein